MWAGIVYAGGTIITTAILSAMQEISDGKINIKSRVNARVYPELQPEYIDASTLSDKKSDIFTKECVKRMGDYRFCSEVNQFWDHAREQKDLKIKLNSILNHPTKNDITQSISDRAKRILHYITHIPDPTEVPDGIQIIALKELLTIDLKWYKVVAAVNFLAECYSFHNFPTLAEEYLQYYRSQLKKKRQAYLGNPTSAVEDTFFQNLSATTKLFKSADDYLKIIDGSIN